VISVGASSQNDVVLRSPGVAPRHLVIQRNDKVFTFLAQPRQVVVLNGERRSRGVLRVGDRIRIGTATLIFKGVGEEEQDIELVSGEAREERTAPPEATLAGFLARPAPGPRSLYPSRTGWPRHASTWSRSSAPASARLRCLADLPRELSTAARQ
jgi:hypothetical protein